MDKKMNDSPELYTHSKSKLKVKLDLSHYTTKSDLKNATGVDTSIFGKKSHLASLKSDADELDIDKLKNVPSGLDSFKSKVDTLDFGKLNPVPTFSLPKTDYDAKISEIKGEIPSIDGLAILLLPMLLIIK